MTTRAVPQTERRLGLQKLVPAEGSPDTTTVDVIAIHGLDTESPRTWLYEKNGRQVHWLRDSNMLPAAIPEARIYTYDWNAKVFDHAPVQTLLGHADNLLGQIAAERRQSKETRPLIFVASCFGGLVLAEAICRASQEGSSYRDVFDAMAGAVFLATPFRGTDAVQPASWLVTIKGIMGEDASDKLIQDLERRHDHVYQRTQNFARILYTHSATLPVCCFYETQKTDIYRGILPRTGYILVTQSSACIDGLIRHSLDRKHVMMNKFEGPSDPQFNLVCDQIQMQVSGAHEALKRRGTDFGGRDTIIDLPVVHEARYDSADVQDSPKCEGGTRVRIMDDINRWADEDSEETLLWLVGPAGTGKSTIARTIADSFARKQRLMAGYFFKRGEQGRNDTSRLFPTLAVQMTEAIPSFKRCLGKYLDGLNKDAVEKKALGFQFDRLLRLPLADLPPTDPKQLPRAIIIDALDECERPEHLAGILSLLSELRNITQVRLRVMLTSRFAPSIADAFHPLLENKTARRLEIHREFLADTKKDIQIFLGAKFADIKMKRRIQQNPWPLAEDMDRLVQLATSPEPLFIYAATLCRFVYDEHQPRNPKRQLDRWLEQCDDGRSQLDQMYNPILAQIFARNNKAESEQQLQFLGAIVLLADPLSATSLAALLAIDIDDVTWWLSELHAVLDIPSEPHKPLRLLHKSFSDFLANSDGTNASPYRVDITGTHRLLAEKCVQRMEAGLKQDICDVRKLDATWDDIGEEEIHRCMPADLEYACLYWVYHLQASGHSLCTYIYTFFYEHFLHWLEALSLLGLLSDGALVIRELLELIKNFPDTPLEFVDLVKDATRVISSFGVIIKHAPLQSYGAVLFFTPVASRVHQIFWNQRMPRLGPIQGVKADWDAHLQTLECQNSYIHAIAFSPDGQVLASGSHYTVRLWSTITGAHLQTLEGHGNTVNVVIFSDNETIASGSRDGTVRIWNLPTGKLLHTLSARYDIIEAVVFLPDGEHLASASTARGEPFSVQLWNLKTGAPPNELFQSYKNAFQDVAFSADGQLMASRLSDNTIEIWKFPSCCHLRTLKVHSKWVGNMVFSLNNQLFAAGSYDLILRLWNIEDGVQICALPSGVSPTGAIAFSPDGLMLASVWTQCDIRIWNVANGTLQDTLSGHRNTPTTVAFSPDSQLLASGSFDKTIKLWDVEMHTHQQPIDGHSNFITKVIFSPDGQLVATGSRDRTARLWDVSTALCLRPLTIYNDTDIHQDFNLAFSPDGKLLASFNVHSSIQIWNVENGTLQQKIDEQSGLVTAVDYSMDGQLAASASFNTVTLYNAETGIKLFTHQRHRKLVKEVVFSPNNEFLASLSLDEDIRLWETKTGMLRGVLGEGRIYQKPVFSPDSQLLAFGQHPSTIVFCDVALGVERQKVIYDGFNFNSPVTISPNNQLLAMHSFGFPFENPICLLDVTSGESWDILQIFDEYATDILFSPDSQIVAVAARDRTVWLWNATTNEHKLTIENPSDFVTKLKFSPDGQTLATASRDNKIRLWNTTTGLQIQMMQYGTGFVRGINFVPEGLVVLESSEKHAWLWNLWGPTTLKAHRFLLTPALQIGMPEQKVPEFNLDADQEWVVRGSERLIWLPPEYRPSAWARRGSTIFIGCASGRVLRVQDI